MSILDSLGKISADGIKALAQNLFSGFYERGLSANKALDELRKEGLGYRRTDFLADYAQGKGTYDSETRIRFVGANNTPSERILEPKYFGTPDKYSMVFKYNGTDTDSGEAKVGYFFYHRNSLDKKSKMEEEASDWLISQAEKYGVEVEGVKVVEGYVNPLWE
jgi:hypothetical protein